MAPREGNSIVKHGVLDERLNVHGVEGLKVADLSICPVSSIPRSAAMTVRHCLISFSDRSIAGQRRLQHLFDRAPDRREVRYAHRRRPRVLWLCARHEGANLPCTARSRGLVTLVVGARLLIDQCLNEDLL
jgi:hypothetical protein